MKKTILALILALSLTAITAYAASDNKIKAATDDQPVFSSGETTITNTDTDVITTTPPNDQTPAKEQPDKPAQ